MIRGIFINEGTSFWKDVSLQGLQALIGKKLYLRHDFKNRIVTISNGMRTKIFVCRYRLGRFETLSDQALANM